MTVKTSLRIRLYRGEDIAIGPGKVDLLEAIRAQGSISGAARTMGMSYRRAWQLVETMNRSFQSPLVATATGGRRGGGAQLTPAGEQVLECYREVQAHIRDELEQHLAPIRELLTADD